MDAINIITTLISNLGFPIACCVALFWKMSSDDKRHKEEVDELKDSIDRNTEVISQLSEHLRGRN